jgi:hypothetical protein
MAVTPNSLILPQKPRTGRAYTGNLVDGFKTFFTPGPNGSKIIGITFSQNDSVTHTAQIGVLRGGVVYILGTASVGAYTGWDYNQALLRNVCDGMNPKVIGGLPVDEDGNRYLLLQAGDVLQYKPIPVIAANVWMMALAFGVDY